MVIFDGISERTRMCLLLAFAIVIVGCGPRGAVFVPGKIVYKPEYAAGFTIHEAGEGSRAIRIVNPWQGAEGAEQWVFISYGDEPVPEDFTGTVLEAPVRRIICMSSSYTAFLGELGTSERIVGVSGAEFITAPEIGQRVRAGDIADVGYDGNLDYERIVMLKPDLMLLYGVSDDGGAVTGKLREMGIPYVFIGEYLEESPLARAEWIVAIGEMCGAYDRGVARFEAVSAAYDELKARVTGLESRPGVMFNAPYRDVWYAPGDRSYMVRLVRDAGGEYVCSGADSRDTRPIDIEEAYVAMQGADYWLNTNHYESLAALLADNPRFAATPPVREGRVFNNNARTTPGGGSDFWESGVVRPDRVLRDLTLILHPEEISATADTTLYYYKRLK